MHIIVKLDEKCNRSGGFWYDLKMIFIVAYFVWATLYIHDTHHHQQ